VRPSHQRVAGAPEVTVRKKELIERRVDLNGGFEIEEVQPPVGQIGLIDVEGPRTDAVEVGMRLSGKLDTLLLHLAVQSDEEIVDVAAIRMAV